MLNTSPKGTYKRNQEDAARAENACDMEVSEKRREYCKLYAK